MDPRLQTTGEDSLAAPWKRHARDRALGFALATALILSTVCVACGEGNGNAACLPEDVERCTCADGRSGFFVCDPVTASRYGACDCDLDASPYLPVPPPDTGASGEGGAADGEAGGGLTFMSPCSLAAGAPQCPSGTACDDFPAKGPHCSKPCKVATDCPAPSPGCNMMGVCKAP